MPAFGSEPRSARKAEHIPLFRSRDGASHDAPRWDHDTIFAVHLAQAPLLASKPASSVVLSFENVRLYDRCLHFALQPSQPCGESHCSLARYNAAYLPMLKSHSSAQVALNLQIVVHD
jgi:hypothetical protein